MKWFISGTLALLILGAGSTSGRAGEVAIFTGDVSWVGPAAATTEAQTLADGLASWGITYTWYKNETDWDALANWVQTKTGNGD